MKNIIHKTGYLYQSEALESDPVCGVESWHRTYKGAQKAKVANGDRGAVYRITGDDSSYRVQA
jgi:hypothetical protein